MIQMTRPDVKSHTNQQFLCSAILTSDGRFIVSAGGPGAVTGKGTAPTSTSSPTNVEAPPVPVMTVADFPALGEGLSAADKRRMQSGGKASGFQAVPAAWRSRSPTQEPVTNTAGVQPLWGPSGVYSQEAGNGNSQSSSVAGTGSQSWAEVSSRPSSNAASPRGAEYPRAAPNGAPSVPSPPHSNGELGASGEASDSSRQLRSKTSPGVAPTQAPSQAVRAPSQAGGSGSVASGSAGTRGALSGPGSSSERVPGAHASSLRSSSSPSSSLSSIAADGLSGANRFGPVPSVVPAVYSPHPLQPSLSEAVLPPPATATEYPPLPNRRYSGSSSSSGPSSSRGDAERTGYRRASEGTHRSSPKVAIQQAEGRCAEYGDGGSPSPGSFRGEDARAGMAAGCAMDDNFESPLAATNSPAWQKGQYAGVTQVRHRGSAGAAASSRRQEVLSVATSVAAAAAVRAQAGLSRSSSFRSVTSSDRGWQQGSSRSPSGKLNGIVESHGRQGSLTEDSMGSRRRTGEAVSPHRPLSSTGYSPISPAASTYQSREMSGVSFERSWSLPSRSDVPVTSPDTDESIDIHNFAFQADEFPSLATVVDPIIVRTKPQ